MGPAQENFIKSFFKAGGNEQSAFDLMVKFYFEQGNEKFSIVFGIYKFVHQCDDFIIDRSVLTRDKAPAFPGHDRLKHSVRAGIESFLLGKDHEFDLFKGTDLGGVCKGVNMVFEEKSRKPGILVWITAHANGGMFGCLHETSF